MSGLVEAASAVMRSAEQRLELAAANVANASTPGYKRQVLRSDAAGYAGAVARASVRMEQGRLVSTGRALDLAISGDGFFRLRDGERIVYSRGGAFERGADGVVRSAGGQVLQAAGGGDLVIDRGEASVVADGTVTVDGAPAGRIAIYRPASGDAPQPLGGALFALAGDPSEVADPQVKQGMTEASNVSSGDEMVSMMAALRQAESGARLIQVYDDLMGKANLAFGQAGR